MAAAAAAPDWPDDLGHLDARRWLVGPLPPAYHGSHWRQLFAPPVANDSHLPPPFLAKVIETIDTAHHSEELIRLHWRDDNLAWLQTYVNKVMLREALFRNRSVPCSWHRRYRADGTQEGILYLSEEGVALDPAGPVDPSYATHWPEVFLVHQSAQCVATIKLSARAIMEARWALPAIMAWNLAVRGQHIPPATAHRMVTRSRAPYEGRAPNILTLLPTDVLNRINTFLDGRSVRELQLMNLALATPQPRPAKRVRRP